MLLSIFKSSSRYCEQIIEARCKVYMPSKDGFVHMLYCFFMHGTCSANLIEELKLSEEMYALSQSCRKSGALPHGALCEKRKLYSLKNR